MTDTNDLRRMLDELSDETPPVPAHEWLAGTRRKVRLRRRARWVGAGAAAAIVCGAAAVVPAMVDNAAPQPQPAEPRPEPGGQAGWPFPAEMDTHRILAARMNEPGASAFEWTTEAAQPADTMYMQFCRLPGQPEPGEPRIQVGLTINGRSSLGWGCKYRSDYPPVRGPLVTQDLSRDLREAYRVEAHEPFTVRMWLEREGRPVEVGGAAFGFALATCEVTAEGSDNIPSGGVPGCDAVNFPGPDPGVGGGNLRGRS